MPSDTSTEVMTIVSENGNEFSAAQDRGCRTVDGLGMLVHQGARQFTLWTGDEAPRSIMRAAAEATLDRS